MKYGGDLLILTLDGLVPFASALQSSRLDPNIALSDKIQGAFAASAAAYRANFGWCMLYNPKNNALIVNVPVREGGQEQFVMKTSRKRGASLPAGTPFTLGCSTTRRTMARRPLWQRLGR
jgi:hypothetical protein